MLRVGKHEHEEGKYLLLMPFKGPHGKTLNRIVGWVRRNGDGWQCRRPGYDQAEAWGVTYTTQSHAIAEFEKELKREAERY